MALEATAFKSPNRYEFIPFSSIFPIVLLDDQLLLTFLRGCKFSLERTKEKLDMHYTLKTMIPEMFSNRDPFDPEIQKVLSLG